MIAVRPCSNREAQAGERESAQSSVFDAAKSNDNVPSVSYPLVIDKEGVRIPSFFSCPLADETLMMHDPVVAADGFTYERVNIERVLGAGAVSLLSGEEFANHTVIPNYHLRSQIEAHEAAKCSGTAEQLSQLRDIATGEIPSDFVCPISQELMRDPVICADGYTYERTSIEQWFGDEQVKNSPMTLKPMNVEPRLVNRNLRYQIIAFSKNDSDVDTYWLGDDSGGPLAVDDIVVDDIVKEPYSSATGAAVIARVVQSPRLDLPPSYEVAVAQIRQRELEGGGFVLPEPSAPPMSEDMAGEYDREMDQNRDVFAEPELREGEPRETHSASSGDMTVFGGVETEAPDGASRSAQRNHHKEVVQWAVEALEARCLSSVEGDGGWGGPGCGNAREVITQLLPVQQRMLFSVLIEKAKREPVFRRWLRREKVLPGSSAVCAIS